MAHAWEVCFVIVCSVENRSVWGTDHGVGFSQNWSMYGGSMCKFVITAIKIYELRS